MQYKSVNRSGFTLIELLVVIAIIAILAAILFPVFAKVREKARATACMSNLKQMGVGVLQYVQDFDESYPNGMNFTPAPTKYPCGWAGQIYPYVKSTEAYSCPDDQSKLIPSKPTWHVLSYALNFNVGNYNITTPSVAATLAQLTSPVKTIFLFEAHGTECDMTNSQGNEISSPTSNGEGSYGLVTNANAYGSYQTGGYHKVQFATGLMRYNVGPGADPVVGTTWGTVLNATGVHNDGSNFLMCDGHAKWFPGSKVSTGKNNPKSGDCTAAQGFVPTGTGGSQIAAATDCSDPNMGATFSAK